MYGVLAGVRLGVQTWCGVAMVLVGDGGPVGAGVARGAVLALVLACDCCDEGQAVKDLVDLETGVADQNGAVRGYLD